MVLRRGHLTGVTSEATGVTGAQPEAPGPSSLSPRRPGAAHPAGHSQGLVLSRGASRQALGQQPWVNKRAELWSC